MCWHCCKRSPKYVKVSKPGKKSNWKEGSTFGSYRNIWQPWPCLHNKMKAELGMLMNLIKTDEFYSNQRNYSGRKPKHISQEVKFLKWNCIWRSIETVMLKQKHFVWSKNNSAACSKKKDWNASESDNLVMCETIVIERS